MIAEEILEQLAGRETMEFLMDMLEKNQRILQKIGYGAPMR